MFRPFEFIPLLVAFPYNIDKSNKEEIKMYTPNTREEIEAMQNIMPMNAFGAFRTAGNAERKNASTVRKLNTPAREAVWMDELRSNPMLPVDSAFLVRLYRCA